MVARECTRRSKNTTTRNHSKLFRKHTRTPQQKKIPHRMAEMNRYQMIKKASLLIIKLLAESVFVAILAILIFKILSFINAPLWLSIACIALMAAITARHPVLIHPWEWIKALRSRSDKMERE